MWAGQNPHCLDAALGFQQKQPHPPSRNWAPDPKQASLYVLRHPATLPAQAQVEVALRTFGFWKGLQRGGLTRKAKELRVWMLAFGCLYMFIQCPSLVKHSWGFKPCCYCMQQYCCLLSLKDWINTCRGSHSTLLICVPASEHRHSHSHLA